jgi:hypothetical protein
MKYLVVLDKADDDVKGRRKSTKNSKITKIYTYLSNM